LRAEVPCPSEKEQRSMSWNPFKRRRSSRSPRQRERKVCRPKLELLEDRCVPSTDVLTFHNDTASTGQNLSETALSPANVKVGFFGKVWSSLLDGQVYAQPLVRNGVNITTGANPGIRDVVFVATEHDSLYAIDTDDPGLAGTVLWRRTFLTTSDPNNNT